MVQFKMVLVVMCSQLVNVGPMQFVQPNVKVNLHRPSECYKKEWEEIFHNLLTFITLFHRMRYGHLNPQITNVTYVVRCCHLIVP